MKNEINNNSYDFKTKYLNWLKDSMQEAKMSDGVISITAPFLDMNNDWIEIFIKKDSSGLILTDIGETISDLRMANFNLKGQSKRNEILNSLVKSYGAEIKNNEIFIKCTYDNFPIKANMLMQCLIKVSDMMMLSDNNIKTIFSEEVEHYLDNNGVRYTKNVNLLGKSKLYTNFEFVIPKFRDVPERCIVPINILKSTIVKATIFSWDDVKDTRNVNSVLCAVINDKNKGGSSKFVDNINAFKEYGIIPITWSNIDKYKEWLTA